MQNIRECLACPCTSTWLKNALELALSRDPVDAANDAEVLASLLSKRCAGYLDGGGA